MESLVDVTLYIADILEKHDPLSPIPPYTTGQYWDGMAGYIKIEVKIVNFLIESDYLNINFVPKGKRKLKHLSETGELSLVILPGWNHPNPPSPYKTVKSENLTLTSMRHPSFREEYHKEFNEMLSNYLSQTGISPIKDFRGIYLGKTPPIDHHEYLKHPQNNTIRSNENSIFLEGEILKRIAITYVRDKDARRICINYYGSNCSVCGFNFGEAYGKIAKGFIHVHHLKPISDFKAEHKIDAIEDLRPVCANCHAVLHMKNPPYSIEELKVELYRQQEL